MSDERETFEAFRQRMLTLLREQLEDSKYDVKRAEENVLLRKVEQARIISAIVTLERADKTDDEKGTIL